MSDKPTPKAERKRQVKTDDDTIIIQQAITRKTKKRDELSDEITALNDDLRAALEAKLASLK